MVEEAILTTCQVFVARLNQLFFNPFSADKLMLHNVATYIIYVANSCSVTIAMHMYTCVY